MAKAQAAVLAGRAENIREAISDSRARTGLPEARSMTHVARIGAGPETPPPRLTDGEMSPWAKSLIEKYEPMVERNERASDEFNEE